MLGPSIGIHIHRGRLSKACKRCRDRRLRCDLQRPSCSSCIRANTPCTGYRDTETVRINDQTESVRSKALAPKNETNAKQPGAPSKFTHFPQDLQVLGRSMFFSYYVADFSRTWDFLYAYQDPQVVPEHLTLGIDAVSLAFLSHQVSSQAARDLARRKYSAALKRFNRALQDPETARKPSTFESALLFDLFEKIMKSDADVDVSNYAHVEGALALVKLRGIEQFREGTELRALLGLALSATIYALSTGNPIPEVVRGIRRHAAQFVDTSYPKWRLSDVILEVTDTEVEMLFSRSASSSLCAKNIEERKFISGHDPRRIVPDGFFPLYDVYPNRMVTQMWNVLRLTRILLCEQVVDSLSSVEDEDAEHIIERAKLTITSMIREILASVPQMTNCDFAARHKLPKDSLPGRHTHTMSHFLDVYILIYALYIVAWSRNCPPVARDWTMSQLNHISEHFGIKEASIVVGILRQQKTQRDPVNLWYVYALLVYFDLCSVVST
ncbi:uncharacterized protein BDR25DRAFT_306421 [Lindgomyces ingoldianus]|uniref:Uncharacterized protein n=1 Tax=Lindgomyces ingoldianus TaxID=673940 RepID=A0ACB6QG83_9PLEO|nr:uncharacterized protein BDR25DRAFT_306421 [Lindgomyces ingoldianus]KAF2465939.1 hypothetical protein BDR25DRAFT_306421 [Lindgomyces ingoldianus]